MTALAPTLQIFFTDRLMRQRQVSPHTIAAYRDTFRLLLAFASKQKAIPPSNLEIDDLDAPLISSFLDHLERHRRNGARTRNARLAAIRSLFRFAVLRHPEHAATIERVLAIPSKRFERGIVTFLDEDELTALLLVPDLQNWIGRRDKTLFSLAAESGMRVSELINLKLADLHLGTGAHVSCLGKGRRTRVTPISRQMVLLLKQWLKERGGMPEDPLFVSQTRRSLSRDAIEHRLAKYVATAGQSCPSLRQKSVTMHVLRHTAAMRLMRAGVEQSVIALWLGHEQVGTTDIYLHADMQIKERALARLAPPSAAAGRFRPGDKLLNFLEAL